jgi:hypothetical protein
MSTNPVHHERTKRIAIDHHFIRDRVAMGQVGVLHVPSSRQFVDIGSSVTVVSGFSV